MPQVQISDIRGQISEVKNQIRNPRSEIRDLKSGHGFTLIEILISVTVLAIVASVTIPSLKRFSEVSLLNTETDKMASLLRQAQSYAQANVQPYPACPANFSLNWQILFINNRTYSIGPSCVDPSVGTPAAIPAASEKNRVIMPTSLTYSLPAGCASNSFINFSRSSIYFSCSFANNLAITIADSELPSTVKSITVDKGGSVNAK